MEQYFALAFGSKLGIVLYVVLYVSAMAVSTVWDLIKYKDDWNYSAVGASGAVSAIPPISGGPSTASSSRWPAARISSGTSLCSWGFDLQPGGITSTLQGHDYRT